MIQHNPGLDLGNRCLGLSYRANRENSLEQPSGASLVVYTQFAAYSRSLPYMPRAKSYDLLLREEKEMEKL